MAAKGPKNSKQEMLDFAELVLDRFKLNAARMLLSLDMPEPVFQLGNHLSVSIQPAAQLLDLINDLRQEMFMHGGHTLHRLDDGIKTLPSITGCRRSPMPAADTGSAIVAPL